MFGVSVVKIIRSQSIPIDVDCPMTAVCSTRHLHGIRRTGLSSGHAIHSDLAFAMKIVRRIERICDCILKNMIIRQKKNYFMQI
jgi:hypothetical protein